MTETPGNPAGTASPILEGEPSRLLEKLGRELFIEFVHDGTQVFDTAASADYGTLAPKWFLDPEDTSDEVAYVLSGRNWRELPDGQSWAEEHPGKTLYIAVCDALLKWREDTSDPKAGTKDFSGTLKEAVGMINVEEKFEGFFMPFSGHDAGEGVSELHWTADISKDDEVCKFHPELEIQDDRYDDAIAVGLSVTLDPDDALPAYPALIVFKRLPYPPLELTDKTEFAEQDDGKLTLKETVLGKELALEFEIPEAKDEEEEASDSEAREAERKDSEDEDEDDGRSANLIYEDDPGDHSGEPQGEPEGSFSDWGPIPEAPGEGVEDDDWDMDEAPVVTADHEDQMTAFFEELFAAGKGQLCASDEANRFNLEIQGGNGDANRSKRIAQLRYAIDEAYERTYDHDQHDFTSELSEEDVASIQKFVDELLADPAALGQVEAKVLVHLRCPKDAEHGVDDCFNAVKDKLVELFDATAEDFSAHPGLDPANEFAPREGDCAMMDLTKIKECTLTEWHFELPPVNPDGTAGPGSFVGPEKTAGQCPVKFELSFQPHELSPGEADGQRLAWSRGEPLAAKTLVSLMLQSFNAAEDEACADHGHGGDGLPGQCLIDEGELCAKCVAHGRSKNLTEI